MPFLGLGIQLQPEAQGFMGSALPTRKWHCLQHHQLQGDRQNPRRLPNTQVDYWDFDTWSCAFVFPNCSLATFHTCR